MKTVDIHEAETRLAQLLATGEEFFIAKASKPIAKVTAIDSPDGGQQKRLGFMKGQFKVPEDFDRIGQNDIATLCENCSEPVKIR